MKKALFLVAGLALSATVHASYLYWTVDQTINMANTGASFTIGTLSGKYEYIGAQVHQVYNDGTTTTDKTLNYGTLDEQGQVDIGTTPLATPGSSSANYFVDLSDVTTGDESKYSYYVEYIAWDASSKANVQIGIGETTTYAQLSESIVEYDSGSLPISQATVWHGGTTNAPEPTSALLMLLGVAGLALKRKQRKLA